MLQADRDIAGMRWQAWERIGGRGWTAVKGASDEGVMGVVVQHLVVSTDVVGGGGGERMGGEELEEGRVVN